MTATDGRLARGERTRTAVLDAAVALASEVGLDGLTLGQLAERLQVSKSGLFAHWSSKEELQLAAIEHARQQWVDQIVIPALQAPRGVRRLFTVHEARLDFYRRRVLPGGCFFASADFEFTGRSGPVSARLAEVLAEWIRLLERFVTEAIELGELPPAVDVQQLAFEVDSAGVGGLLHAKLLARDPRLGRDTVLRRLRELSTKPDLLPAK